MPRSDMSDFEWEFIKAVLRNKIRGKKRVDDRRVINGIFYDAESGHAFQRYPSQQQPGLGGILDRRRHRTSLEQRAS